MQAFKNGLRIVSRRPVYVLAYVVMFSVLGLLMAGGAVTSASEDNAFESTRPAVAIVDRDSSEMSKALAEFLYAQGERHDVIDDPYEMQYFVASRDAYLVVIPEGYGAQFQEAIASIASGEDAELPQFQASYGSYAAASMIMNEQADQFVSLVSSAAALNHEASLNDAIDQAREAAQQSAEVAFMGEESANDQAERFAFYLTWGTYSLIVGVSVCVGLMLIVFNRQEVARRSNTAPVRSTSLALSKAAAATVVTLFVVLFLVLVGLVAYWNGVSQLPLVNVALMVIALVAFAFVPLAFSFFLAELGLKEITLNAVANITGLVMSFLGGTWVSFSLMTPEVLTLSYFVPTSWCTRAVNDALVLTDASWESVAPILGDIGIMLLFAMAIFAVALAVNRARSTNSGVVRLRAGRNALVSHGQK